MVAGGEGDDTLDGGAGVDVLDGGPGDDTLLSAGRDTLANTTALEPVHVGLARNQATGSGTDRLGIESAIGSRFGDILTGDEGANRLAGLKGDDRLNGCRQRGHRRQPREGHRRW